MPRMTVSLTIRADAERLVATAALGPDALHLAAGDQGPMLVERPEGER